jgi:Phr family secreted Rap phosphatase inhibitor
MKKIIILLSLVVTAVIFFGMNENSTARIIYQSRPNTNSNIQYQVNVHPDMRITNNLCPLIVELTDGSGRLIGQPRIYIPGENTYYFFERGPVKGTRMAKLTNMSGWMPDDVCIDISLSDSKTGVFNNGVDYKFNLFVQLKDNSDPANTW